jgi:hypothetical protein
MSKVISALYAALIATPLIMIGTEAAAQGAQDGGPQASPPSTGGGGGFRGGGGGFRGGGGGFRGGYRGFYGGGFYGGFGPGFGFYDPWYDPFWGPRFGLGYGYGYGFGYYPSTRVIVRERVPAPGYLPQPDGPPPQQNWYRCDNPAGYYPYVRTCNGAWQSVPVTPPGAPPR